MCCNRPEIRLRCPYLHYVPNRGCVHKIGHLLCVFLLSVNVYKLLIACFSVMTPAIRPPDVRSAGSAAGWVIQISRSFNHFTRPAIFEERARCPRMRSARKKNANIFRNTRLLLSYECEWCVLGAFLVQISYHRGVILLEIRAFCCFTR